MEARLEGGGSVLLVNSRSDTTTSRCRPARPRRPPGGDDGGLLPHGWSQGRLAGRGGRTDEAAALEEGALRWNVARCSSYTTATHRFVTGY
jgi:hypothetical protein